MADIRTNPTSPTSEPVQAEGPRSPAESEPYSVVMDPSCQATASEPYTVAMERISESLREIAQYADTSDCASGQLQAASCRAKTLGPYLLYYTVERSERVVRLLRVAGGGSYY